MKQSLVKKSDPIWKSTICFNVTWSCHLALNTLIDYVKRNLDKKQHVIAIFLDLSKTFETIDHELLLLKREKYGFFKSALELMKNYLSNRQSIVNFYGKFSSSETLRTGVPQGSILGPLVFVFVRFTNDVVSLSAQFL